MKKNLIVILCFASIVFSGIALSAEESPLIMNHSLMDAVMTGGGVSLNVDLAVTNSSSAAMTDLQISLDAESVDDQIHIPIEGGEAFFPLIGLNETVQTTLNISSPYLNVMEMVNSSTITWNVSYTDESGVARTTVVGSIPLSDYMLVVE